MFGSIEMQLYHSASGSIKGHFKIQLYFFPPSSDSHSHLYHFLSFYLSISSSFLFPHLSSALFDTAHLYLTTTTHTHDSLILCDIAELWLMQQNLQQECNGEGIAGERQGYVAIKRSANIILIHQTFILQTILPGLVFRPTDWWLKVDGLPKCEPVGCVINFLWSRITSI